jgi:hypothetical protein
MIVKTKKHSYLYYGMVIIYMIKYDLRSIVIRFIIFDLWVLAILIYGLRLWLLGELD